MHRHNGSNRPTLSAESETYEIARIRKTNAGCSLCEEYAVRQSSKPIAVISCEGACLRGEIARQAANLVCHSLAPDRTVRVCLGGAFTKDTGQRQLVRNAQRVVAVEGCAILCASRMMRGVIDGLRAEVIVADRACAFNRALFSAEEMPEEEIRACVRDVARTVMEQLNESGHS